VSSLRQVQPGAIREMRPIVEDLSRSGSRLKPVSATSGVSRNEGVPGSSPGVGFVWFAGSRG
jgi:hypothetical protein